MGDAGDTGGAVFAFFLFGHRFRVSKASRSAALARCTIEAYKRSRENATVMWDKINQYQIFRDNIP